MKFRDFVGDEDKDVILKVKEKLESKTKSKPKKEVIEYHDVYIGFGISKPNIKRVFDYIKSWLIRYKIPFESINPYLSVSISTHDDIDSFVDKKENLIEDIENLKKEFNEFEPLNVFILRDERNRYSDYICVDIRKDKDFYKRINEIYNEHGITNFNKVSHVRLFEIERDKFPMRLFEDMLYSMPEMINLKAGSVGVFIKRR